jgi:hypothetical protein
MFSRFSLLATRFQITHKNIPKCWIREEKDEKVETGVDVVKKVLNKKR